MAITNTTGAALIQDVGPGACSDVDTVSVWQTANTDLGTANTNGILRPGACTAGSMIWLKRHPGCTRIMVRSQVTYGWTVSTTDPIVGVVGLWNYASPGQIVTFDATNGNSPDTTASVRYARLDATTVAAAGITLALVVATKATAYTRDDTYIYSNPGTITDSAGLTQTMIDLLGCDYFAVPCLTAAAYTGGTIKYAQVLQLA